MLTLYSQSGQRDCGGLSRRDFLRLGTLGVAGLSLPWAAQAAAAAPQFVRDKSIVLLFLCGGPSHIETFAPNMDAPAPLCSLTGETATSLPGVTFGATFPKLAALAHRLTVVRSYSPHTIADHAKAIRHVLTAGNAAGLDASWGAIQARLRGGKLDRGMPPFTELIEDEREAEYREDMNRMRSSNSAGRLGAGSSPFAPDGDSELNQNLTLGLPLERLAERQRLRHSLDRLARATASAEVEAMSDYQRQALEVLAGQAVRRALDLSREPRKTVERYDTSSMKTGWLEQRPSTLGTRMLLARRLCEAGCRFVTVGMAGWDNHGNERHPGVADGMRLLGTQVDHAVSVFLQDIEERGLSDKILLVVTGEFGRAPKIEKNGGRDHWPALCPLLFAGGGLKVGQAIGRMAKTADVPASDPYTLDNLTATMLHTQFDIGQLRLDTSQPRDLLKLATDTKPIAELF